jgi:hypothetical protein
MGFGKRVPTCDWYHEKMKYRDGPNVHVKFLCPPWQMVCHTFNHAVVLCCLYIPKWLPTYVGRYMKWLHAPIDFSSEI